MDTDNHFEINSEFPFIIIFINPKIENCIFLNENNKKKLNRIVSSRGWNWKQNRIVEHVIDLRHERIVIVSLSVLSQRNFLESFQLERKNKNKIGIESEMIIIIFIFFFFQWEIKTSLSIQGARESTFIQMIIKLQNIVYRFENKGKNKTICLFVCHCLTLCALCTKNRYHTNNEMWAVRMIAAHLMHMSNVHAYLKTTFNLSFLYIYRSFMDHRNMLIFWIWMKEMETLNANMKCEKREDVIWIVQTLANKQNNNNQWLLFSSWFSTNPKWIFWEPNIVSISKFVWFFTLCALSGWWGKITPKMINFPNGKQIGIPPETIICVMCMRGWWLFAGVYWHIWIEIAYVYV